MESEKVTPATSVTKMDIGLDPEYKNKAFLRFGSEPDCNSLQTFRLKTDIGLDADYKYNFFGLFLDFDC